MTKEGSIMTLPVIVAYAILFLIVSTLVRVLVSGLVLPRLQAWSRARAMEVIIRFRQAYGQGHLHIDAGLFLAVSDAMTDMVHDANRLALPMLVRYRPVLPDPASGSDHSLYSRMERHPDENVRSFHREWSEAVLTVIMANSPGVVIYLLSLLLLCSPVIVIVGVWRMSKHPVGRSKPHPAALLDRVVSFATRDSHVVYRNASGSSVGSHSIGLIDRQR
ncbi:MAG: hypothetical protein BGO89_05945 [Candidatus Kapaibacterium thiocyanatum]|uniref:Uncharacterized protein n=1 Tax=Candidatus Kapaibacterium thiocyanatum TaxID=1895771 RepID=A0A1M3KZD9_9BACT|nr:MAG: hypothetical protein BGO89_05945 ['Candidatus Kapabacteria' thiocyanatum]